ncbi:MAG: hypothetical protein IJY96_03985 [Oscillospiraceae bacterium]|nr:hypothetical protein [Oscillospiraceae bacterium]
MYVSMSSASRENILRAIRFERPDYIPMTFHINEACWAHYSHEELFRLMEDHPFLFPGFEAPKGGFEIKYAPNARKAEPYTDPFGCVWQTAMDGIVGSVHSHPLEEWAAWKDYAFPDPEQSDGLFPVDWADFEASCARKRAVGELVCGDLRHGHTFLQLCDLRGYENLLEDMAEEEPLLDELIEKLTDFNLAQIRHFVSAGVEMIRIPEDLGMQLGPMLSPADFCRYIKPAYKRLMTPARDAGVLIHMHSDGDIRALCDDIIEGGVDVLNLQDLVNGVDWIASRFRGRTCIELDIDRQRISPFGSPRDIDALVRNEVESIGCRDGGLMMIYGLYPEVPIENVKALMDAMERYAFYYSD